jgi:acyl carrier protein
MRHNELLESEAAIMEALERELLGLIVDICRIPGDIPPITEDTPLIGPESPLGIDSLDAIEIVVGVQKKYHVRIDAEQTARQVLQSLRTLADFIRRNR